MTSPAVSLDDFISALEEVHKREVESKGHCVGWFISGDRPEVVRCDDCARFANDGEALHYAVTRLQIEAGRDCPVCDANCNDPDWLTCHQCGEQLSPCIWNTYWEQCDPEPEVEDDDHSIHERMLQVLSMARTRIDEDDCPSSASGNLEVIDAIDDVIGLALHESQFPCPHSACRQNWIDTGDNKCIKGKI